MRRIALAWTLLITIGVQSLSLMERTIDAEGDSMEEVLLEDIIEQEPPGEGIMGAIRHPDLVRDKVVDASSVAELEEQARANASSSLSNISLADIESDNFTQTLQLRYRERKKQERLLVIQAQILQRLRMRSQPNITSNMFSDEEQRRIAIVVDRMHRVAQGGSTDGTNPPIIGRVPVFDAMQRLQSFYPSCSLPNNTDKSTWEQPDNFRVYYDIPFGRYSLGTQLTVMLAKLRLYKITENVPAGRGYTGWGRNMATIPRQNLLDTLIHRTGANGINVSIYQYLKPLRFNKKERKRLVDSRTLPLGHEGWVEFNVISSLNHWLHHRNKNFGFDIEVEDAYGNKLNPNLYFQNMNCSSENASQDPPFPNIMELHPEMAENESSLFDNETYPTLDLQTADVSSTYEAAFYLKGLPQHGGLVVQRSLKKRHLQGTQCSEETTYVTFAELGLDGVILSPEGFQWTFCSGNCPQGKQPDALPSTNLLDRLQSTWKELLMRNRSDKQETNCMATSHEPLAIIYYDDDFEVVETVLEDFLPRKCSCNAT